MIPVERFLVESIYEDEWLAARAGGVTATAVAKAATPSGFAEVANPRPVEVTPAMQFGSDSERELMSFAQYRYGLLQNRWLIAGEDPRHLCTPDGLSLDHLTVAECKTSSKIPKSVPRVHRDQCLWQMWVTGATRCLYVFNQRAVDDHGGFYLALLEPLTFWVERDDKRISELVAIADRLLSLDGSF